MAAPGDAVPGLEVTGAEGAAEARGGEAGDGRLRGGVRGGGEDVDPPASESPAPGYIQDDGRAGLDRFEAGADAHFGSGDIDGGIAEGDRAGTSTEDLAEVFKPGAVDGRVEVKEGGLPLDDEPEGLGRETVEGDGLVDGADGPALQRARLKGAAFEEGERFTGAGGEAEKRVVDGGVEFREGWQELGADAVPGVGRVSVGFVAARLEAELPADGSRVGAPQTEERAKEGAAGGAGHVRDGQHAAEPAHAGAAEEVQEDGFDLVVGGVAGDDGVALLLFGGEGEELVPHEACSFFDAAVPLHGDFANGAFAGDDFEAEGGRVVADELEVGGRAGPELVVEMGHFQLEAEPFAEGEQEMEEGEGVGPAGDCDEKASAAAEEAFFGGEPRDTAKGVPKRPGQGRGRLRRFGGAGEGGEAGRGLSGGRVAATRYLWAALLRLPGG